MKRDEQNETDGDAIGHNRNFGIVHRKIVPQMDLDHFPACGLAQAVCSPVKFATAPNGTIYRSLRGDDARSFCCDAVRHNSYGP
jgi:hypothetical protein